MNRFLLLGLGNPGDQYVGTRHNAGWMTLDWLVDKWSDPSIPVVWKNEKKLQCLVARFQIDSREIFALKPQTFMNRSGETARAAVQWYLGQGLHQGEEGTPLSFPQLVVFHDDLDIETGRYKLQFGSGPKIHNGVNSVRQQLQTDQYWSARLGVDSRQGNRSMPGDAYVLQRFLPEEKRQLQQAVTILAEELLYTVLQ